MQSEDSYSKSDGVCKKGDTSCQWVEHNIEKKLKTPKPKKLGQQGVDAIVISGSVVVGVGPFVSALGFDVVMNNTSIVLFLTGASNIPEDSGSFPPGGANDILSPQFGGTATGGVLRSTQLDTDSTADDIIQAYSGRAWQRGYSAASFTENTSSSVDANGHPNDRTTTHSGGISVGMPDTVGEYHQYMTFSKPIGKGLEWDNIFPKNWCYPHC